MEWITDPNIWISLITLTVLEIVLGIDNIIFISILAGKLPEAQQGKARTIGLMLALITRVLLLCSIFWLTKLIDPLFTFFRDEGGWHFIAGKLAEEAEQRRFAFGMSGKDLVLFCGGLFLLWKSVHEIHGNLEGEEHEQGSKVRATMSSVITQIVIIDIVFSLDSVITAVGLAQEIGVMIAAVVLAMGVMLVAAGPISNYVNRHPTIKMLALSFLLLVGVVLVADGLHHHIQKGYIYFAMAFSFAVEMLNIRARTKKKKPVEPVDLRTPY
jgi:predicted tellurium resistance membrane protein TerC